MNRRTLLLLPLLAAGMDLARATIACGPEAQTCLEAAGRGWLGPVAALLVVVYAAGAGLLLARWSPRRGRGPGFGRSWALATTALAVTASGQDLLARALGDGAQLGVAPLATALLCVAGGALLAFALRAAREAAELVAPASPRALVGALWAFVAAKPPAAPAVVFVDAARRGRAPPQG